MGGGLFGGGVAGERSELEQRPGGTARSGDLFTLQRTWDALFS
jgi:hypothetical protein